MTLDYERSGRWQEPIRIGTSAVGVAILSVWTYYQGLLFYSWAAWSTNSLTSASIVLGTTRPLWFASFFPALALGLAWYVFSHRGQAPPTTIVSCGVDRLTISQTYATLCTGLFAFAVSYRILPFLPFVTSAEHRSSEHLLTLTRASEWGQTAPVLERQALVGALAVALIAVQAWGILPRLGGSRRRLLALLGLLLAGGLGTAWLGLLESIPSPVPHGVFDVDRRSPVNRGLLFDASDYEDEANLALAYLLTHNHAGKIIPLHWFEGRYLRAWSGGDRADGADPQCEVCQLPEVGIWTTNGLPLRLTDKRPTDLEPTRVVEVPRHPVYWRVYDPRGTEGIITVPTADALAEVGSSDWVIAKIDFTIPMETVIRLLTRLRDHGVRRIDLAVIPYGFRPLPVEVPRLSLNDLDDATTYEPRERLGAEGAPIAVTRYRPPEPGGTKNRLSCPEVHFWERYRARARYELESPGSVPGRVRVAVGADTLYGEFVGVLQGALTGGVEIVEISIDEETE